MTNKDDDKLKQAFLNQIQVYLKKFIIKIRINSSIEINTFIWKIY
jgi:hypothetical protein